MVPYDYGYIRGTIAPDGDPLDCMVGLAFLSRNVYLIDQVKLGTKIPDEPKVMFAYPSLKTAMIDFLLGYSDNRGADRIGKVRSMTMDGFKGILPQWIAPTTAPRVHIHVHDGPRLTMNGIARAAMARLPDVAKLELVRGNGYFYVVGEFKKKSRSGQPIPITSGGIYTNRLGEDGPEFGLDWWVRQVIEVVEREKPSDYATRDRYGRVVVDSKWTGTYTANVKGRQQSIEATVEASDAYVAGDKLRALFEAKYGTDFYNPVARFKGGPKRIDPASASRSIAMSAGPEED